ncbi:hypothetical protein H8E07_06775 [bacterium]|nr:hypothetical protein [bacterium]
MTRTTSHRVVLCAILLALGGCTPQIAEWPVQIGRLVDDATGYYAFTTPLGTGDAAHIGIEVATAASIEGRIRIVRNDTVQVYPRWEPEYARQYVPPEQLRGLRGTTDAATAQAPSDTLELGYFVQQVDDSKVGNFKGDADASRREGVAWRRASEGLLEAVQETLDAMRATAAREGGERIIDMAVFWTDRYTLYGLEGVYVTGRLVAFGDVVED